MTATFARGTADGPIAFVHDDGHERRRIRPAGGEFDLRRSVCRGSSRAIRHAARLFALAKPIRLDTSRLVGSKSTIARQVRQQRRAVVRRFDQERRLLTDVDRGRTGNADIERTPETAAPVSPIASMHDSHVAVWP